MKEAVCGKMTHFEYVQRSRQGSPTQWLVVGHMSLAVTFFGNDFSFPITNIKKECVCFLKMSNTKKALMW